MKVAAVDVGTNSVRLLVADATASGLNTVDRQMVITRLGYGVDATGRLDDHALQRTLDCIDRYAVRWRELGASVVRISATSAVRDAADRDRFFDGVRERTGVDAEVLSGEVEARTAFLGATAGVTPDPPTLVLDIGGGSTELILGTDQPEAMSSRQLGCVRVTERALRHDPPTADELAAANALIDAELEAVDQLFDPSVANTLIGVAGTVTTIAAIHLGLDSYDPDRIHGTRVPNNAVADELIRLAEMTAAQRAQLPVMVPGREDVIVGGCLILNRVMDRYGFDEVLVSESDILDGLAIELARELLQA